MHKKSNKISTFELNIFESKHQKNVWKKNSNRTKSKLLENKNNEINFFFYSLKK